VLFIDEAYELGKGVFGKEALTTILAAMTDPEYNGMVIIIAGYPNDIEQMLAQNVGLKSRFTNYFDFLDWSSHDCVKYFMNLAHKQNFLVDQSAESILANCFEALITYPGWANGRDVNELFKQTVSIRSSRVIKKPEDEKTISVVDLDTSCNTILNARRPRLGIDFYQTIPESFSSYPLPQTSIAEPPTYNQSVPLVVGNYNESVSEVPQVVETNNFENGHRVRDEGVSDQIWLELQSAEEEYLLELQIERDEIERLEIESELRKRLQQEFEKRQREMERVQQKLKMIRPCPVGYNWTKTGGGWRCAGGSHFVTDRELDERFSF
jgi:hypothetical protein